MQRGSWVGGVGAEAACWADSKLGTFFGEGWDLDYHRVNWEAQQLT